MNDQRLEEIVGNLLRTGVALSAGLVAVGGAWYLAEGGTADYHRFVARVRGLQALAVLAGPQKLILIGLLVLIATPVARVAFALVAFALERDKVYVALTAVVLALLGYSLAQALLTG